MAARLATFKTRCLSLCNRFSRRSIGHRPQFLHMEAYAAKENTRIDGAPPTRKKLSKPIENLLLCERLGSHGMPDPCISETDCTQHWKPDICPNPNPKPHIFVIYHDNKIYFAAYSVEKDGTISPKYYIYPPSFLEKYYSFTMASCNGLFHFHDKKSGHVLWNPTTGEYKILPKPFVDHSPNITYSPHSVGMWYEHRFEDYKLLNLVKASFRDEKGFSRDISYHIDLYSLKTNSWKRIPFTGFDDISGIGYACSGVFYCQAKIEQADVILSFDFSSETFSSLPQPDKSWQHYYLEYKGLLCYLESFDDEDHIFSFIPCKYELWVMIDGSWTRESVFHTRGVEKPLCFSPDGKLLYFVSLTDEVVVFDRVVGKLKYLGVDWSKNYGSANPMMIPFFESFVQLN